jgi:hypothetical protein
LRPSKKLVKAPDGSSQSWQVDTSASRPSSETRNCSSSSYTTLAPEVLDSLGPEERRTVYSILGLRVNALPDKSLRVRGAFGEENLVCHLDRTSTR